MKKLFSVILSSALFFSSFISASAINVHVNNNNVKMDVAPVIVDGRTLVPVAAISNALNSSVSWDESSRTVTITKGDKVISLQLDNKTATVDGQVINLDVPAKSINGRTMVPVSFIAQAFNEKVEWHPSTQTVLINSTAPATLNIPAVQVNPSQATYKIVRIVDGDTLIIDYNGVEERVRLIGVDTPESVHPDATKNSEFGKIASDFSKKYLDGKEVSLELDVQERDKYGRILAYVYVGGQMYNKILLQEGMAKVATYPPNVRYVDDFKALEKTAREGNKGLWAYSDDSANISAPTTPIVTPNNSTSSNQYTDESGNGLIKGNISSSGEKIYHMPGMRDYNKTKIDISKGEKWFKTEQEALDAGFRKAMQ
jgi:endonuclease YncB( thermonuclease family)